MGFSISMEDLQVKQAKAANSDISMVGPRKFTFSEKLNKHLDIKEEDIGRDSDTGVGINMGFSPKNDYLVIYKNSNGGRKVGGSYKSPETYCADICNDVLAAIGKELTGSGTVRFTEIEYTTFQGTETPVVLVKLDSYSANAGVFKANDNKGKED